MKRIANVFIDIDEQGRLSLYDLYLASGKDKKNDPTLWIKDQQTVELIDIFRRNSIDPVRIVSRANTTTIYVAKGIAYAYAMWIGPEFFYDICTSIK
jgi:hypothetical protein